MDKTFSLKELSEHLNIPFSGDENVTVSGVNELSSALSNEVSFLSNEKYTSFLQTTKAGIICVEKETILQPEKNYLLSDDPSKTFEQICNLLLEDHSQTGFSDIHPTACVHPSAKIGKNVQLGPYVVIDRDVVIEDGTEIRAHVSIGPKSTIGKDSLIHPNVVVREDCHLGKRVILQPSCVIGSCGYGYHSCKKTGHHTKIKHLGKVILEDDVEIGSSTTIDRGRFSKTIIKKGTKIDNQCMIGHNCEIGEHNLIVSMSGVSGSVKTGRNVIIAAGCGLVGHIEIADGVILAARSAPIKSIKEPGGIYLGAPAQNIKKEMLQIAALRKLPSVMKKLKKAEKLLDSMETACPSS
ncbi:MAG: UDP-3-O-acylglucosamine N-acyltransferase [Chlamydiia bacterium]|nr:UDP-3-O-acylglucosamine N-acyltransferase [Chlamydiia bacterium]MCH9617998.1 UDP-3-O-acylglucosamine N-acyltransferase [Chlamydiia bacterium]MCH9623677.1 UDP-3-O-acylglucosamine N-acyltransferase [Chlamydiia bacterium]